MQLTDLIALLSGHNWLGLIALLTLLARKWCSADSKFPITIPPTWQPTVTAAGGLVYGLVSSLQQGQSWGEALLSMAITAGAGGFLDGLLTAIFDHDNAPVWARSIVFIFDDLTGGGSTPKGAAADRIRRKSSRPPPPNAGRVGLALVLHTAMILSVLAAAEVGIGAVVTDCTPAQQALQQQIEQAILADLAAGKTRTQVIVDVGALLAGQPGADVARIVADAIAFLIDTGVIPPNILPAAKTMLGEIQAERGVVK